MRALCHDSAMTRLEIAVLLERNGLNEDLAWKLAGYAALQADPCAFLLTEQLSALDEVERYARKAQALTDAIAAIKAALHQALEQQPPQGR
jgi:hypothetical protein